MWCAADSEEGSPWHLFCWLLGPLLIRLRRAESPYSLRSVRPVKDHLVLSGICSLRHHWGSCKRWSSLPQHQKEMWPSSPNCRLSKKKDCFTNLAIRMYKCFVNAVKRAWAPLSLRAVSGSGSWIHPFTHWMSFTTGNQTGCLIVYFCKYFH